MVHYSPAIFYTSGVKNINSYLQFYWPKIIIRNDEFYLQLETVFRINKQLAGFRVMGFGIGLYWSNK